MAGTFTIGEQKVRPGVYHRYENYGGPSVAGAINGIGAGVIRANWGPLNQVLELEPSSDVNAIFGSGGTEDLITEMFNGGLSSGFFVRVGHGGTEPSLTLKTATAESAEEKTAGIIRGAYPGSRAFSVTIRDSLTGDAREFFICDGDSVYLKLTFDKGGDEVSALKTALSAATTEFTFTPESGATGTLANIAQAALTGGTEPTVENADYSAAFNALEPFTFNVICIDTEQVAVQTLLDAWMDRTYEAGAYPMAVLSANLSSDVEDRMAVGPTFNDFKIAYLINTAISASGVTYPGYLMAARVGGMVAATPANQSVTHAVVTGMAELGGSLTNTQITNALKKGCLVLTKNAAGQVWIEQGINTLITLDATQDEGWKKIRRTKTRFELMQRMDNTIEGLVGKINNDPQGRATIIAAGNNLLNLMAAEGKLLAGGTMTEDSNNPAQGDSAWFIIQVDDIDSMERIYLTYRFRFAAE